MKSVMRHLMNILLFLLPPTRYYNFKRLGLRMAGFDVDENVRVNGMTFFIGAGNVSIGESSWIGMNCRFYPSVLGAISIGSRCDIAPNVTFVSGSHEIGSSKQRAGAGTGADIVVKDGCWIGTGVTVLTGVTIGSGAIVGAGAVVNKDIPSNSIYAGVPAKLIRGLAEDE